MKPIELLTNKIAADKVCELLEGANKLKDAKKYFEKIDRTPEFLNDLHQREFFEYIDDVDIKLLETIEGVNRAITFLIHCELDNKINN